MPDANKFVYYDASGQETAAVGHAVKRIPIVEVEMSSFDKDGNLVDSTKAVMISISEYGPGHTFLHHTSGH